MKQLCLTILASSGVFLTPAAYAQLDHLLVPVTGAATAVEIGTATPGLEIPGSATPRLLTAAMLTSEAERELAARLALKGELKLSLAQPWKPVKLPANDFVLTIPETPSGGISGTFLVHVRATSGGQLIGDWQIPMRAQLWQEVWTAGRRLDRGQPLDRELLTPQKVDVLRESQPLLSADIDPSTLELVQTVAASRAVAKRDVIARPLVRRGHIVEVVALHAGLSITMKALALENGAAGELIKLRNLQSRREFSGQILDENKVQVHF
jgi:flagella basal body P-ring formation protein FlgA